MAQDLHEAARAATTDSAACKTLRSAGYAGLAALATLHGPPGNRPGSVQTPPAVRAVFDTVSGQRHGWWSRLYWHVELEPALDVARRERKPLLSVRMLGRLDEDLCCANSRFFRTVLYADERISKVLRERFVLHWASVRPVPKLTVDFGDGRKLERTITGNAAHLVLDAAAGRPVDCIPGLYGPAAFLKRLDWAEATSRESDPCASHEARLESLFVEWAQDAKACGLGGPSKAAAKVAAKGGIAAGVEVLQRAMTEETWKAMSARHLSEAEIDATAWGLLREGLPGRAGGAGFAMTKAMVEDPLFRVLRSLQQSLAEDGVRNEYDLHRRVHEKFGDGRAERDADSFTEWVYSELFHMPPGDPWLGLAPDDAFTGIAGSGEEEPDPSL